MEDSQTKAAALTAVEVAEMQMQEVSSKVNLSVCVLLVDLRRLWCVYRHAGVHLTLALVPPQLQDKHQAAEFQSLKRIGGNHTMPSMQYSGGLLLYLPTTSCLVYVLIALLLELGSTSMRCSDI